MTIIFNFSHKCAEVPSHGKIVSEFKIDVYTVYSVTVKRLLKGEPWPNQNLALWPIVQLMSKCSLLCRILCTRHKIPNVNDLSSEVVMLNDMSKQFIMSGLCLKLFLQDDL